jgi:hypothetical protein
MCGLLAPVQRIIDKRTTNIQFDFCAVQKRNATQPTNARQHASRGDADQIPTCAVIIGKSESYVQSGFRKGYSCTERQFGCEI